jgi:hypothetical protein
MRVTKLEKDQAIGKIYGFRSARAKKMKGKSGKGEEHEREKGATHD